ncbi:L-asparagine transporter-like permease [Planomicrobium sp. HSC-17F08]|nr:L-asparagine transporter-like permease [Planomicrobium sp. HSC-17F08]
MRWMVFFSMLGFTLLLINNFFPEVLPFLTVSKWFVLAFIFVIFICISVMGNKEKEESRTFKWTLFSSLYLMFLIVALSLLGGQSTSGISLDNPIVWILLLVSLLQIINQLKHRQSKKSQEI